MHLINQDTQPLPGSILAVHLTAKERQALDQLPRADGVLARWPVGRVVTRILSRKGLVRVYPEFVLLTDAGRVALAADQESRIGGRPSPSTKLRADGGLDASRSWLASGLTRSID